MKWRRAGGGIWKETREIKSVYHSARILWMSGSATADGEGSLEAMG